MKDDVSLVSVLFQLWNSNRATITAYVNLLDEEQEYSLVRCLKIVVKPEGRLALKPVVEVLAKNSNIETGDELTRIWDSRWLQPWDETLAEWLDIQIGNFTVRLNGLFVTESADG